MTAKTKALSPEIETDVNALEDILSRLHATKQDLSTKLGQTETSIAMYTRLLGYTRLAQKEGE